MCGRTTHHRPTQPRGHPSPQSCRHWCLSDLYGILGVVAIPHPMGSLEAFRGGRPRRTWKTAPNRRENPAPEPTMGRSQRESELHRDHRSRIAPRADRNEHYAASTSPYRCHPRYRWIRKLYTSTPPRLNPPPPQPLSTATSCRHSGRNIATSPLPQPMAQRRRVFLL